MIYTDNTQILVPNSGGTLTVRVEYTDVTSIASPTVSDGQHLITSGPVISNTGDTYEYTFVISERTSNKRKATIYLGAEDINGNDIYETIYLNQFGTDSVKGTLADDFVFSTAVSSFSYAVRTEDELLFEGRAIKAPDKQNVEVGFNELLRDYVHNGIGDIYETTDRDNDIYIDPNAVREFMVTTNNVPATSFKVLDGYGEWNGGEAVLSEPVNGHFDPRMCIVSSIYCPSATTKTCTFTYAVIDTSSPVPVIGQPEIKNVTE